VGKHECRFISFSLPHGGWAFDRSFFIYRAEAEVGHSNYSFIPFPPFFSPKPVLYVASSACVLCVLAYPDPGACFSLSPTHQTVARQRFMLVAGLASRKEAAARAAAQAADVKARAGRMRAADGDAADNEESNGGDIGRACREPPLVCFLAIVRAPPASGLTDGRSALAPGFFCFFVVGRVPPPRCVASVCLAARRGLAPVFGWIIT
jgi:hypothetical protein